MKTLHLPKIVAHIPTAHGPFRMFVVPVEQDQHVVLVTPELETVERPPLVRIHSECCTGDVFGSLRCDCRDQLEYALAAIQKEQGVLLYLRQEGRGIGLLHKIEAYVLQEKGRDTVQANEDLGFPADARHYALAAQILLDMGIDKIRLLTNNPQKIMELEQAGVDVVERVPIVIPSRPENAAYLQTKKEKFGHLLDDHGVT